MYGLMFDCSITSLNYTSSKQSLTPATGPRPTFLLLSTTLKIIQTLEHFIKILKNESCIIYFCPFKPIS